LFVTEDGAANDGQLGWGIEDRAATQTAARQTARTGQERLFSAGLSSRRKYVNFSYKLTTLCKLSQVKFRGEENDRIEEPTVPPRPPLSIRFSLSA
jgi:hypothetical protein